METRLFLSSRLSTHGSAKDEATRKRSKKKYGQRLGLWVERSGFWVLAVFSVICSESTVNRALGSPRFPPSNRSRITSLPYFFLPVNKAPLAKRRLPTDSMRFFFTLEYHRIDVFQQLTRWMSPVTLAWASPVLNQLWPAGRRCCIFFISLCRWLRRHIYCQGNQCAKSWFTRVSA